MGTEIMSCLMESQRETVFFSQFPDQHDKISTAVEIEYPVSLSLVPVFLNNSQRDIQQPDGETFQMMLHKIMERFDRIEDRLSRMNRQTAALEGDKLLDNQDMCELLGVTKRTLARYRQKKLVTYYMIDGRTYYKASEVQEFLNRKGKVLPARIKKELGIQS